ncbi:MULTISPECIES: hypothetical protein [Sinorhizobium]|uniref:Uncharacterized protein n=2 Tax=Sinorhizobium TaxID=28105 RepID=A0A2S3YP68_9HYPH|nr:MULTISPECIES: hypothetical protein [Sinorhizobium]ASY56749.1 hypothetical protein SS05631_c18170 [Sinorhizobium sp. CCBAU 05631]AUX76579.1 hypothetical protein NXT3_CH02014 [Sinorhizobium fredii]PDT42802.1 hypothetical protein CO656_03875 [Sinorhizobium sp. FG01]PDT54892.1 hypothetical protein CO664_07315 [Sinorhizobium sp. NG07B]POH31934.1 hypothetical protein ATY30_10965 [Sinorhizobium americanum]
MFSRPSLIVRGVAAIALAATAGIATPASSGARDKAFFEKVAGQWKGPGEIVAGKYKGTKFTCDLTGEPTAGREAGIKLDGFCRVGVFKQPMSAMITQKGGSYTGKFLDGADGKGLDVVSGNVASDKVVVGINRKKLNGAMIARLQDAETMNITISVKVEETMVPVIGVSLNRQMDNIAVGSIK